MVPAVLPGTAKGGTLLARLPWSLTQPELRLLTSPFQAFCPRQLSQLPPPTQTSAHRSFRLASSPHSLLPYSRRRPIAQSAGRVGRSVTNYKLPPTWLRLLAGKLLLKRFKTTA